VSTDNTLINTEMNEVRTSGKGAHYFIKVQLLVNKKWITPLKMDLYSVDRDYEGGYADIRVLSFMMLLGAYTFDLLPFRNDIQVDVTYVPVGESGGGQSTGQRAFTRRFRGLLMDPTDPALSTNVSSQGTRDAMDNQMPQQVEIQLVEESVYDLQMRSVGGKYRNMTPYEVLMTVLTATQGYMDGKDEKRILGVNPVGTPNATKRTQIVLPHGTKIGKVPNILQNDEGGVFGAGLGCYLQDQYWYVFPLYDTAHASKQKKTVTIYAVPSDRYDGSEKTYRETDNRLIILASGDVQSLNISDNAQVQSGNGLRFLDATKLLNGFATNNGNRMLIDKATNLFEFAAKNITEGINNIQWSAKPISSNPFVHYSAMARLNGRIVTVQWRHGDGDLLDPGELVEFYAVAEGKIDKFKGVLLGTRENRVAAEPGMNVTRHAGIVDLKLFIENQPATAGG
jgi:hypothetical protein